MAAQEGVLLVACQSLWVTQSPSRCPASRTGNTVVVIVSLGHRSALVGGGGWGLPHRRGGRRGIPRWRWDSGERGRLAGGVGLSTPPRCRGPRRPPRRPLTHPT